MGWARPVDRTGHTVLRSRFVGLPLQMSLFSRVEHSIELLGLGHERFDASVDARGNLLVAVGAIEAIIQRFPKNPDPAFLEAIESTRRRRCSDLQHATKQAAMHCDDIDQATAQARAAALLDAISEFMPYPILSKILPRLLSEASRAESGAPPSGPSIGMLTTQALNELGRWLAGCGETPEQLLKRWPGVPAEARRSLEEFCRVFNGVGPVAWESPGFETPAYVLQALIGRGTPIGPPLTSRPSFQVVRPRDQDGPLDLEGVTQSWMAFIDAQIWYLRSAFYEGLVPLIRNLGRLRQLPPSLLLFAGHTELTSGGPDQQTLAQRFDHYLADSEYLRLHGSGKTRLTAIFGNPK